MMRGRSGSVIIKKLPSKEDIELEPTVMTMAQLRHDYLNEIKEHDEDDCSSSESSGTGSSVQSQRSE